MKGVMSLWFEPKKVNEHYFGYRTEAAFVNSMELSVKCAETQYGQITMHTDQEGIKFFESIKHRVPNLILTDDLQYLNDNNYPPQMWGVSKVYTYSIQKKPFFHFDNDFYIFNKIPSVFFNKDCCFQNVETSSGTNYFYERLYQGSKEFVSNHIKMQPMAFNCGFIAFCNQKALNATKEYWDLCNLINSKVEKNFDTISDNLLGLDLNIYYFAILQEQMLISQVVKNQNLTYECLFTEDFKKLHPNIKVTHLMASSKRSKYGESHVRKRLKSKNFT